LICTYFDEFHDSAIKDFNDQLGTKKFCKMQWGKNFALPCAYLHSPHHHIVIPIIPTRAEEEKKISSLASIAGLVASILV
jgi:hypothetical protein